LNDYEFTLKFAISAELARETLETRLFDAGCDDAVLGTGQPGRVALRFDRTATSAREAIESALRDVREALPQARLIEAEPDLVGVSDIADLFAFSRQNMRKLVQTHPDSFPLPLHEGRSALWHLADVLDWFETRQARAVDPALREVAEASMTVNAVREAERLAERDSGARTAQKELG
jgi:hypothetical protein